MENDKNIKQYIKILRKLIIEAGNEEHTVLGPIVVRTSVAELHLDFGVHKEIIKFSLN